MESTIIDYVSFEEMLEYTQRLCSDPGITLNRQVYHSEMNSCDRNRAIAYLLKSKDMHSNYERDSFFVQPFPYSFTASPHKLLH